LSKEGHRDWRFGGTIKHTGDCWESDYKQRDLQSQHLRDSSWLEENMARSMEEEQAQSPLREE